MEQEPKPVCQEDFMDRKLDLFRGGREMYEITLKKKNPKNSSVII